MNTEKRSAFRAAGTDSEGQIKKELSDNLYSHSENVKLPFKKKTKEELDREYLLNTFTRFQLQRVAQNTVLGSIPVSQYKNYTKCHRISFSPLVTVVRNPETCRAFYNGVVTCSNPLLCPVCAPRIMGIRSAEIKQAVHAWLNADSQNTCYMLTFTAAHSADDLLSDFLPAFKKAVEAFWRNGSVKRMFEQAGRVGRITSFEFQASKQNGFHPHQHVLVFCKATDFTIIDLNQHWLNALRAVGLDGLKEIAFDIVEARSAECYLTKISSEMALGNIKDGRKSGHFSPMQLISEMASGCPWAKERFIELFKASQGIHSLFWSRGLKSFFGIGAYSDQDITEGTAQDNLSKFIQVFNDGFRVLTAPERALLRNYAAVGDFERAVAMLQKRGAEYIKPGKIYEA